MEMNTNWKSSMAHVLYISLGVWSIWILFVSARVPAGPATNEQPWASILYTAVIRGKVALPCDISPPAADDAVVLILWYKDEDPAPIYTLDARRGTVEQARQSSSPHLESRAYFNMINRPAFLQLDPVQEADAGEYRCRVDFRKARTVNTVITLKVIVPPGEPLITDEEGRQVKGLIGPYNEGEVLRLTCEAAGGKPRPAVTWWKDYTLLDDSYSFIAGENLVRNQLEIPELRRHDLLEGFTCQASNNNITVPASSAIILDLNLKPTEINVMPYQQPLSSNQETEITCTTTGSRPTAVITWWKNNKQMKLMKVKENQEGDKSISVITFTPTKEDNGKYFSCRTHNPLIAGSALEEGWKLEVYYTPEVTLQLGSKFKKGEIQEGNDVYLECNIHANPWVSEVSWYFENHELRTNTTAGIVISNQSLVLQKVQRANRGRYACMATNTEGHGRSNEVFLRIRYAPECKQGQKKVYGVGRQETVLVSCNLDADPEEINFRWRFNSSGKSLDITNFKTERTRSLATYVPNSDDDYGSLICWGANSVGRQRDACIFTIIQAGPPESLYNCSMVNHTEESLHIECSEGYNGGLTQVFTMEVYDTTDHRLQGNITALQPTFFIQDLPSGAVLRLLLYASNKKGRSPPISFTASTLQKPEKLTAGMQGIIIIRPVLGLLIGIVVALVIIAVVVIISMKIKKRRKEKASTRANGATDKCQTPLKKDTDDMADSEEKGPDIIPAKIISRSHCHDDVKESSSPTSTAAICHWSSSSREVVFENTLPTQTCSTFRKPEDVTYAELALPKDLQSSATVTVRRKEPPTEYAKLDLQRHMPAHIVVGDRDDDDEGGCTSCETPLMNNKRESAV